MSESRWRQNITAEVQCKKLYWHNGKLHSHKSHCPEKKSLLLCMVHHAWVFQQTLQILKLLNTGKYIGVFWLAPSIIDLWQFIQTGYITGIFCPLLCFLYSLPSLSPHFQLTSYLSLYFKTCLCPLKKFWLQSHNEMLWKNKIHVCQTNLKFSVSFSWEIKSSKHMHLWVPTCKVHPSSIHPSEECLLFLFTLWFLYY